MELSRSYCNLFSITIIVAASFLFITFPRQVECLLTSFEVGNGCSYPVWLGLLTGSGTPPSAMEDGRPATGFMLKAGQSATIEMPSGWSGRLWGRTGCNFSSNGVGKCQTGDCAGKLDCKGAGATPPATLAEFTLQGQTSTKDFYDVSLVDGYNLPITITPGGTHVNANQSSCGRAGGCNSDVNKICPSQLQVVVDDRVVACKSACLALKTDQYCCSGAFANSNTCKPTTYSRIFKSTCPNAYTYAFDDPTSLYRCSASNYSITFCSSTSMPSSATTKKGPWKLWAFIGTTFYLSLVVEGFP